LLAKRGISGIYFEEAPKQDTGKVKEKCMFLGAFLQVFKERNLSLKAQINHF